jgi:hypothetical protein
MELNLLVQVFLDRAPAFTGKLGQNPLPSEARGALNADDWQLHDIVNSNSRQEIKGRSERTGGHLCW